MRGLPSLLRRAEHAALRTLSLSGRVIDLGGERGAEYLSCIAGEFSVTAVNLDREAEPDILHDLEEPLALVDASYDHALLINVLEHIFDYRQLLTEAARVVRPGGTLALIVPFLFPVHPSPSDYWRFTQMTLAKELELLALADIRIVPLGSGVFAARYVMLDRLLPYPLRFLSSYTLRYLVGPLDAAFTALARALGKKYDPADYALGYMATGVRAV
jgi:SAM-dependent methyltransferase